MRVTRRSTGLRTPPIMESARKQNNYTTIVAPSEGFHRQECIAQVSARLLTSCFSRMSRDIWYSIAPNSVETSNISTGTRQGWQYILPLLLHTGLLEKKEMKVTILQLWQKTGHICTQYVSYKVAVCDV